MQLNDKNIRSLLLRMAIQQIKLEILNENEDIEKADCIRTSLKVTTATI